MVGALDLPFKANSNAIQKGAGRNAPLDSQRENQATPAPSRHGSIALPTEINAQRFWEKIERRGDNECWPWLAGSTGFGYGRLKIGGKLYSAHRIAYALTNGAIPAGSGYHGIVVMHTCDNPRCCNPAHLRLGTQQNNARDMAAKGRNYMPNGTKRPEGHAVGNGRKRLFTEARR